MTLRIRYASLFLVVLVAIALPAAAQRQPISAQLKLPIHGLNLGDSADDLVYTPLTPCRIIDTRLAGGFMNGGTSRSFVVKGTTGFPAQGGTAGGCGVPTSATAVLINFVAVDPQGTGNLKGAPYPNPIPVTGSILNYQALNPNLNIANGFAFPVCDSSKSTCTFDITLFANGAGTQVVADVFGYFKRFPTEQTITSISPGVGLTGGGSSGDLVLGISTIGSTPGQVLTSTGNNVQWASAPIGPTGPTGPAGPTGATGATGAAGSSTRVTPNNMGDWYVIDDLCSTGENATNEFTNGEATTPPLGTGSFKVTTTNGNQGTALATEAYDGALVSSLTTLRYSTKTSDPATTDQPYIYIKLSDGSTIFFIPANNQTGEGATKSDVWQTWDALNGLWNLGGDSGPAGAVPLSTFGGLGITGIRIASGCGPVTTASVDHYTDDFEIAVGGATPTVYNFERN